MAPDPQPAAPPIAAGEMAPFGTDVVAEEVGQLIQVTNDASTSTSQRLPGELCQSDSVDSSKCCSKLISKPEPVDDVVVSKWILSVIGTHSALREAHNMGIFVDTVNELAPTTNWVHIMENESFNVHDESVLNLMMGIYARACKFVEEPSPLEAVCSSLWKNTEHQKCLMRFVDMCQGLKILSDVLNFAPFPFKVKVAVAASRKYPRIIENWLGDKSDVYQCYFLEECVNLLKEIISNPPTKQSEADVMNMYWGSFHLFVEVCQPHSRELLDTQILEEQVRELTLKHLLQADSFDMIKNHIVMLQNERQFNKDLIIKGTLILKLKTLAKENDKALKYLRKGLLKYFNDDPLFHRVDAILTRNMAASKKSGFIIVQFHDYCKRAYTEMLWIDDAVKQKVEASWFILDCDGVLAKLELIENHICDINKRVALLSKERPQNLYSQCEALDTLAKLWGDIGMLWKKLAPLTKAAENLCLIFEDLKSLFTEKLRYATRFHNIEQLLKEEKESSNVCQALTDLQFEVKQARKFCKEKMAMFPEVTETDKEYEQILDDKAMSWRYRLLLERNILGEMRDQGPRDICAPVSTVVTRESLGRREAARYRICGHHVFRPIEKLVKLSEDHLQDIVRAFYARNKRKGREKLDVCLERMKETGVVTEADYNSAGGLASACRRYKISSFEKMDPSLTEKAFHKLEEAIVLIATFGITKGYYDLQPGDVYDVGEDDVFETNQVGLTMTHAVVVVGYGLTPEGLPYYAFQNSYGPGWGNGGFGMVTCRSIKQLYSAKL